MKDKIIDANEPISFHVFDLSVNGTNGFKTQSSYRISQSYSTTFSKVSIEHKALTRTIYIKFHSFNYFFQ